jgi:hypothetical protein
MRKLVIVLTLAAAALFTGLLTWKAEAQTWRRGALAIDAASQNYTPIEKAACWGWGPHCPPGRHWVCGPRGYHCWCARC